MCPSGNRNCLCRYCPRYQHWKSAGRQMTAPEEGGIMSELEHWHDRAVAAEAEIEHLRTALQLWKQRATATAVALVEALGEIVK
jgi:hypothetical protein